MPLKRKRSRQLVYDTIPLDEPPPQPKRLPLRLTYHQANKSDPTWQAFIHSLLSNGEEPPNH